MRMERLSLRRSPAQINGMNFISPPADRHSNPSQGRSLTRRSTAQLGFPQIEIAGIRKVFGKASSWVWALLRRIIWQRQAASGPPVSGIRQEIMIQSAHLKSAEFGHAS